MALVITFIPDPLKAAAEMARVVKPGGIVATYMWDFDGRGFPLAPLYEAMESLKIPVTLPPGRTASCRNEMRAIWQKAGLQSVASEVIRIRVVLFSDFDDFWDSNTVPVGPSRQVARGAVAKRAGTTQDAPARTAADRRRRTHRLRSLRQCREGPRPGLITASAPA